MIMDIHQEELQKAIDFVRQTFADKISFNKSIEFIYPTAIPQHVFAEMFASENDEIPIKQINRIV